MHSLTQTMHKMTHLSLQVLAAGRYEFAQGQMIRPHQHSSWELVYYLDGAIQCPTGCEIFAVVPGILLLTPPHTIHYELSLTAWACYAIAIEAPPNHPWPRIYHDDDQRTVASLCDMLVREWRGQEPTRDEMLDVLLRHLDILFQRNHAQHQLSTAEQLVRRVEHLLEERMATAVSMKELAREVGISQTYLRTQFTRLRGRTPSAYLQALRIQHAIALINTSSLSLETIAHLCGYDSASHLSRHVVRARGRRPGTFRKQ
jgi:AraC-like DNA-binding protein/mannose-6-phosphate isomerase-like protein (cupin superfamily)